MKTSFDEDDNFIRFHNSGISLTYSGIFFDILFDVCGKRFSYLFYILGTVMLPGRGPVW